MRPAAPPSRRCSRLSRRDRRPLFGQPPIARRDSPAHRTRSGRKRRIASQKLSRPEISCAYRFCLRTSGVPGCVSLSPVAINANEKTAPAMKTVVRPIRTAVSNISQNRPSGLGSCRGMVFVSTARGSLERITIGCQILSLAAWLPLPWRQLRGNHSTRTALVGAVSFGNLHSRSALSGQARPQPRGPGKDKPLRAPAGAVFLLVRRY